MVLSLAQSLFSAAYMLFITRGPFLYMETFGLSRTIYALHQGAMVRSFSLISLFSGKILKKLGAIWCVISGTGVIAIGSLSLLILGIIMPSAYYLVTLPTAILYWLWNLSSSHFQCIIKYFP
ncbi:hypothetical protein wTkk_000394 [Wolbachia endosymbiont of Trichogramma kaykai]